jgi:hypothetical protein
MKRSNIKKQYGNIKKNQNYQNYENELLFKSNSTIKKYINERLKEINSDKKNESLSSSKKKVIINQKLSSKSQGNLHHTNTRSTTLSDKSTINRDLSREINSINLTSFDIDDDYYIRDNYKDSELEMIKEENENLKIQLEEYKKKENNLEDILNNILKESQPISIRNCPQPTPSVQKYPIIQVKRKKCKRITKYIRKENEEIYIDQYGNYMRESKTDGNI